MTDTPDDIRTAGDRYTSMRAMLAKKVPLSLEQYLAAQTVFVLMDLLAEQQVQTEMLTRLSNDVQEAVVKQRARK